MNQLGKNLQTKRKVKQGRKKTGTILQSPNLRSKVVFLYSSMFKGHAFEMQPRDQSEQ